MVLIVKMSVFEYSKMDTIKLDKKRQMKFSFKYSKLFVAFYTVNLNNMHFIKKNMSRKYLIFTFGCEPFFVVS